MRIAVQLIIAQSGEHIWAEKYDHVLDDIFDVEEEVTHTIVAAIAPQIHAAEDARSRRLRPDNLNAHALTQNGWASDALAIDANCSLALRTMAMVACVSQHHEVITPDPGAWADRRHPRHCY